jgi:maleylpyruvate isomerase
MGGGPVTINAATIDRDRDLLMVSTERLLAGVDATGPGGIGAPSLLPGWTVGHVLTHLARNADGFRRIVDGAARGEVVDQYPHGRAGRATDIETGAARPPMEIVEDVHLTAELLDAAIAAMPDEAWDRSGRTFSGEIPAGRVLVARRREVEIHHADLGLGYSPPDWPADLVARELADAVAGLAGRLPDDAAVEVIATDTGVGWGVGAGTGAFTVRGDAAWLLAWLIGRHVVEGALDAPDGLPVLGAW